MDSSQTLLLEIDDFLERSGMTQTRFGQEAMNNSSFVRQLRRGGSVTLRTVDRVRAFMTKWKGGAVGPRKRARPTQRAQARVAA